MCCCLPGTPCMSRCVDPAIAAPPVFPRTGWPPAYPWITPPNTGHGGSPEMSQPCKGETSFWAGNPPRDRGGVEAVEVQGWRDGKVLV